MKGFQLEDDDDNLPPHQNPNPNPDSPNSTPVFANFPHHPSFLSPPPHLLLPRQQYHPPGIGIGVQPQLPLSENTPVDSSKRPRTAPAPAPTSSGDGSSVDASQRPRGRPRGSKNKPKPPVIITCEPNPGLLSPYILELPGGADLIASLTRFTRRRNVGICVLSATGAVENVTLSRLANCGRVTCNGRFDIISITACIMTSTSPFNDPIGGFAVSLAGSNGEIIVGKVLGPLLCAGTVFVVATSFSNPGYTRLPPEVECNNNDNNDNNNNMVTGGGGEGGGQSSSPGSASPVDGEGSGCGVHTSVFSQHQKGCGENPGEVLWTPTPLAARQPQRQPR